MWLYVFFDLPVLTKKERKAANDFRKSLLKDGFTMMQLSVYIRHCASAESAEMHTNRVGNMMPERGFVSILQVTDRQYGNAVNYWGRKSKPNEPSPQQLEMF
jgi:CRISPR-associated protein Cas2